MSISEGELLDALVAARVQSGPDEAQTIPEIAKAFSVTEKEARRALQAMREQGRLEVHRVRRIAIDGRNALVPAYTIKAAS